MRKNVVVVTSIVLLGLTPLQARSSAGSLYLKDVAHDSYSHSGSAHLTNFKTNKLNVSGSLHFDHIEVLGAANISGSMRGEYGAFGSLKVSGSLNAKFIECGTLRISGSATLKNFNVKKDARISGGLNAKNGTFHNLEVTNTSTTLANVEAKNILVKKCNSSVNIITVNGRVVHNSRELPDTQRLYLEGSCTIHGTIEFESGLGEVIIKGSDVTISGGVIGGIIKQD